MKTSYLSAVNIYYMEAIFNNRSVRHCTKITSFARFRQTVTTLRNKQILNLANASIKDIIFVAKAEIMVNIVNYN